MKEKNKKLLTAHCLVKNEENWIWYAINSILPYVDYIFVFDTGSTDRTVAIVKSIKSPKIILEQKGNVNKNEFAKLRAEMLERTTTPWFMILDGDEVWPEETIKELRKAIENAPLQKEAIVVPQWICVGDIFHYSKPMEDFIHPQYKNKKGFRMVRAIKNSSGLRCIGEYGIESYADKNNTNVSYWSEKRLIFLMNKFFHLTFLPRSSSVYKDRQVMMRGPKRTFYKGKAFSDDMKFPEVFYRKRPDCLYDPFTKLSTKDQIIGFYFRGLNFLQRMF